MRFTGRILQCASHLGLARRLKLLGAVLLLLGLVLPLYSCRGEFLDSAGREVRYVDPRGTAVADSGLQPTASPGTLRLEPGMTPPPGVRYHKHYHYFFGDFSFGDWVDWFRLGGFLWPLAAAVFADRLQRRWPRWLFRGLEPLLVLETAFSLALSALLGAKEIGFWIAWAGVILYSLGAAGTDTTALLAWKPQLGKAGKAFGTALIFGAFLASSFLSVMVFFEWFRA